MAAKDSDRERGLRILLVINGTDFGGTESALAQIAKHLMRRSHHVRVISIKPLGRLGRQLRSEGISITSLEMEEEVGPRGLWQTILQMRLVLIDEKPQVIHSFLPRANIASRLANRLLWGSRPPHFSSERSTDFNRSRQVTLLNRWTVGLSDRVLAISPEVQEVLQTRDRLPPHKVELLENGIDVQAIDNFPPTPIRQELSLPPEAVLFCSVGRLIYDKGYVYLVQALARLRDQGRDAYLLLVGEGEQEAAIRQEVERHGLQERVHLAGFRKDVWGILAAVDVFVLSSLEEGIPVVLLEAMARSLPIVATDVGGVAGLMEPNKTGYLVPAAERWNGKGGAQQERDSEALAAVKSMAEAMDTLLVDLHQRQQMGRLGRERVELIFSIEQIVDKLEGIYRRFV